MGSDAATAHRDAAIAHEAYVESLAASGAILSESVERAFRRVRRHRFLEHWYRLEASRLRADWKRVDFDREDPDPEGLAAVYSDRSLVTRVSGYLPTASSSQPSLVAKMLEAMELGPGMRVLEIGTGTGYNAALLAEIVDDPANVHTIELQEDVAAEAVIRLTAEGYGTIHVHRGDATLGSSAGAPYARIEATVGCPDISPRWLKQLAPGGMMLIPLQHGHLHPLVRIVKSPVKPGRAVGRVVGQSAFMPMQGAMACANLWQSYLLGGLPDEQCRQEGLPISLPVGGPGQDPLDDLEHRAFYFFLTLSSRELWRTNEGYGLADPAGQATVIIAHDGLAIRHRGGGEARGERLCAHLCGLLRSWDRLGRPSPDVYDIEFVPKKELPILGGVSGREWVIERIHTWQVVRLST